MRVLATFVLCAVVAPAAGWSSATAPAPPACSSAYRPDVQTGLIAGTARIPPSPGHPLVLDVSVGTPGHTLYDRFCGPATVVVHLHGTTFTIRGGRCFETYVVADATRHRIGVYQVEAGLRVFAPAAPAAWVGLDVGGRRAIQAGTVTVTAEGVARQLIQLHGAVLTITGGRITINRGLLAGAFAFHLRDGTSVSGSWTCG